MRVCDGCLKDGAQDPTYPFALMIFRDHNAHLESVPRSDRGQTDVGAVCARCVEARLLGRPVAFLYLVPSYHNPTGLSLSEDTRKQLVELAHELDFWLVCDDVYQLLPFDANRPPAAPVVCHEVVTRGLSRRYTFTVLLCTHWAFHTGRHSARGMSRRVFGILLEVARTGTASGK